MLTQAPRRINRRAFLSTAAAATAGAALLVTAPRAFADTPTPAPVPVLPPTLAPAQRNNHLAWVWQFDEDGAPEQIRYALAAAGLGIMLKTHDGTSWQGTWDHHPMGIADAEHVKQAAAYFEAMNVPFHAWCVVSGTDPIAEARMAADVLSSGVRSLTFDLEPREGRNYWLADASDAKTFGDELRRLAPNANLIVAPDPRPWQLKDVPMKEFAGFCNGIAPQTYWDTFNTSGNEEMFAKYGVYTGEAGVTPELLLDNSVQTLGGYGLPITPVGAGAAGAGDMQRFLTHANTLGMSTISVWRYGVTNPDVWSMLRQMAPPGQPPQLDQSQAKTVLSQWLQRRGMYGGFSPLSR